MNEKSFVDLVAKVGADFDATFTWDYGRDGGGLDRLYEKAKRAQWNVSDDLDWSTDVDPERLIRLPGWRIGNTTGLSCASSC